MLKTLIGLAIETRKICLDIALIKGKAPTDPLDSIPPALKIYRKFAMFGITDQDAHKLVDGAIERYLHTEVK